MAAPRLEVDRGEGVATEQEVAVGEVEGDLVFGVPGDVQCPRPSGHVEFGPVGERLDRRHGRDLGPVRPDGRDERADDRRTPEARHERTERRVTARSGAPDPRLVQPDRHVGTLVQSFGESDVVGASVGEQPRLDVGEPVVQPVESADSCAQWAGTPASTTVTPSSASTRHQLTCSPPQ